MHNKTLIRQNHNALRDGTIGMAEGMLIPLTVASVLAGSGVSQKVIIIGSLAIIAAGAITMGISGYETSLLEQSDENEHVKPNKRLAVRSGFVIALSYVIGGLIPVIPFIAIQPTSKAFYFSLVITFVCSFILGWFKGKWSGYHPLGSALRISITGILAAAGAFYIARTFLS